MEYSGLPSLPESQGECIPKKFGIIGCAVWPPLTLNLREKTLRFRIIVLIGVPFLDIACTYVWVYAED